jgi:adenine-specific DNA-methyltransferase
MFFLLGYLNSSFFRDYYFSCGRRRGGRLAFTQRILNSVKISLFNNDTKKAISDIAKNIVYGLKTNKGSGKEKFVLGKIILSCIKLKSLVEL